MLHTCVSGQKFVVLLVVHVSRFNCTFYIRCLWTFISGPTGGSCWQVLLYSYARGPKTWICCPTSGLCQQVLLYMQYNGSPDIDMWSYWWSMLVGFTIYMLCKRSQDMDNCGPTGGPWSQV